jgi:hypothetical protein
MIRIFLALLLSFAFFNSNTQGITGIKTVLPVASTVYVSNNGKTEVYHVSKNCSALKRCTHEVKEVSEDDAVNKRRLRNVKLVAKGLSRIWLIYLCWL